MNKTILVTGILMALLSVLLGAFGAHSLKEWVDAEGVKSFETGVRYQMYHGLFLMILGQLPIASIKFKKAIYVLTLCGVLLFSFSIYFLATNGLTSFDFKNIAFLTPLGGSLLISAWVLLLSAVLTKK
ncbi:MAG: DUF423 domain-containing protein [Croceitalea sp.]|nr:DUF423 domain-containing protein [Croceitalea sp.]